ncbi:hypothetical protein FK535_26005 [Mycolicibacterium sp. 018/SC-01/001]|uniref:hypothetical protein n=1 Tax=Mycolicibacterium sp. 018/SC-01/001 TaxID=2592069 RepID=UPI00118050FA|nr:hypothetical protein [Mycolicibacterium sp. 018/SC-01/001]TRW78214.1 hypothetical protein FK535_26005 [Mycolicibacterium sp. 018/SC-01/001]
MTHPPHGPSDGEDQDDLAALDFSAAGSDAGETDLSALLADYPTEEPGDRLEFEPAADIDVDGVPAMPLFTVTNPPGTVTVTTYMDGRVHRVDLSPGAATMAESVLGEEIVVIAGLATQDARSAQYSIMLEEMREQGHDNATTRDFLTRDLDLPTPEQAQAARAELFTTRYAGEHD